MHMNITKSSYYELLILPRIYIYKAEKLSVCLSVSNAYNSKNIASVEAGLRLI